MFKKYFLTAMSAFMLAGLASCSSSEEEPIARVQDEKDMVSWNLDLNVPDDMRTRAAAGATVGADGLYTFSREIDRVWYAVYYNGSLLYHSEEPLSPGVQKKGDGFTTLFKFHKDLDPTKIYMFFWAGNKEDNVSLGDAITSSAITLNFPNRCVSVDPKYLNGNNSALQEYDSFAGYFQLSSTRDVSNYNLKVTLRRPFAQIHILSDEFTFPGVNTAFPNGVTVVPGFGKDSASLANYSSNLVSPTTWFFDSSVTLNPGYRQNEYIYSPTNYEFTNTLSATSPERVTFKNRTMDYLGCYYVFAPITKQTLKTAAATGNTSAFTRLNLGFRKKGTDFSTTEFASVLLPAEGLKANERYVIYNHANTGDGDGGGPTDGTDTGGGGFLSANYAFEVVTAPGWDNTNEISN